jgi:hypothetical protein
MTSAVALAPCYILFASTEAPEEIKQQWLKSDLERAIARGERDFWAAKGERGVERRWVKGQRE